MAEEKDDFDWDHVGTLLHVAETISVKFPHLQPIAAEAMAELQAIADDFKVQANLPTKPRTDPQYVLKSIPAEPEVVEPETKPEVVRRV